MESVGAQECFTSWDKLLRCGICWGIYRRPHTLPCGHSFCASCLRNLATLSRDQYQQSPFHRIKFSCPTCRKRSFVSSILNRRLNINYSIQNFVDHWREQDKKFQNECYIKVRSIATQSGEEEKESEEWDDGWESDPEISIEEESRMPCRIDIKSFPNFEDSDDSLSGSNNDDFSEHSDTLSDTSSNGDLLDNLDRMVIWNRGQRARGFVSFVDVFWNWIHEIQETLLGIFECRSRSVMAMIWCGYTFSIMIIANGFFPYMILYSFLFFVILYAESAQQRRNRHRIF